jgi:hypothetical protein
MTTATAEPTSFPGPTVYARMGWRVDVSVLTVFA